MSKLAVSVETGQLHIDCGEHLLCQFVSLQSMAEPQDGALIGQASMGIELGKLPVERGVTEGFFHAQVRQAKPLAACSGCAAWSEGQRVGGRSCIRVIRRNELDQGSPGSHELHLGVQLLLAGSFDAKVQIKVALLHGLRGCHASSVPVRLTRRFCRMSPGSHS